MPTQTPSIEVSDDAEKLWVFYPSAVENTDSYVRPSILIEFGGRNSTLPQSTLAITPDIAEHVPDLALPMAQVSVLSAARTFWEKATLIHEENNHIYISSTWRRSPQGFLLDMPWATGAIWTRKTARPTTFTVIRDPA